MERINHDGKSTLAESIRLIPYAALSALIRLSKRALRKLKFSWNAGNAAICAHSIARVRDKRVEELGDSMRAMNIGLELIALATAFCATR